MGEEESYLRLPGSIAALRPTSSGPARRRACAYLLLYYYSSLRAQNIVKDMPSQTRFIEQLIQNAQAIVGDVPTPSSPLAAAGLERGDVIQEVNHQPVKNVAQFEEAMKKAGPNPLLLAARPTKPLEPGLMLQPLMLAAKSGGATVLS